MSEQQSISLARIGAAVAIILILALVGFGIASGVDGARGVVAHASARP